MNTKGFINIILIIIIAVLISTAGYFIFIRKSEVPIEKNIIPDSSDFSPENPHSTTTSVVADSYGKDVLIDAGGFKFSIRKVSPPKFGPEYTLEIETMASSSADYLNRKAYIEYYERDLGINSDGRNIVDIETYLVFEYKTEYGISKDYFYLHDNFPRYISRLFFSLDGKDLFLTLDSSKHNYYAQSVIHFQFTSGTIIHVYSEILCSTGLVEGELIGNIGKSNLAVYIEKSQEYKDFLKTKDLECYYPFDEYVAVDPIENRACLNSLEKYSDDGDSVWLLNLQTSERKQLYKNLENPSELCRNKKRVVKSAEWTDSGKIKITTTDREFLVSQF